MYRYVHDKCTLYESTFVSIYSNLFMHKYAYTYGHICICMSIHRCIHVHIYIYIHTYTIYIHTCMYMYKCIWTHTHIHIYIYTYIHNIYIHTCMYMYKCIWTHTHTYIYTLFVIYMYIYIYIYVYWYIDMFMFRHVYISISWYILATYATLTSRQSSKNHLLGAGGNCSLRWTGRTPMLGNLEIVELWWVWKAIPAMIILLLTWNNFIIDGLIMPHGNQEWPYPICTW